jgi:hypothetical protein
MYLGGEYFNARSHLQEFEDFDIANEDDVLEEFLGIPRKATAIEPNSGTNTEANVGKLDDKR